MLRVDPWACILAALLLLTIPLDWFFAALLAAVIHEMCHLLAIFFCKGKCGSVFVGCTGAVIDISPMDTKKELLCAFAGPAGSFSLILLCHVFPKLSICGCVQGAYNLLPVYPMDGGRMLRCILEMFKVKHEKIIEMAIRIFVVFLIILICSRYFGGMCSVILLLIPVLKWSK